MNYYCEENNAINYKNYTIGIRVSSVDFKFRIDPMFKGSILLFMESVRQNKDCEVCISVYQGVYTIFRYEDHMFTTSLIYRSSDQKNSILSSSQVHLDNQEILVDALNSIYKLCNGCK